MNKSGFIKIIPIALSILGAAFAMSSCNNKEKEGDGTKTLPAPKNVTATVDGTTIRIQWDAVENAGEYEIERSFGSDAAYFTASSNSYTDASPKSGTNNYAVRAVSADGKPGDWSATVSKVYPEAADPLNAPLNVKVDKNGVHLVVTWNAVPKASGYLVYRCAEETGEYELLKTADANTATDDKPLEGDNYYKVRAMNSSAQSEFSGSVSYTFIDFTYYDAITAFDSFNSYMFNTGRKMYRKDTGSGNSLAVNWTQSMYFDMIMNAYKLTGDDKYLTLMNDHLTGCDTYCKWTWYDYGMWDLYDDMMWWVGALARAYLFTKDLPAAKQTGKLNPATLLANAVAGFDRVWYGNPEAATLTNVYGAGGATSATYYDIYGSYAGDDPEVITVNTKSGGTREVRGNDGGMYWDYKYERFFKAACINYPTVIAAMYLYEATGNAEYLNKAKEVYEWASNNIFRTNTGAVADGKHMGNNDANWITTVYNQATCIGSAALLYLATKDQKYLDHSKKAMDYVVNSKTTSNNVLMGEGALSQTDTGSEHGVYFAILAQYAPILIVDCGQTQYTELIERSIRLGWYNRDRTRNLTNKDLATVPNSSRALSVYTASGIPALMLTYPGIENRK